MGYDIKCNQKKIKLTPGPADYVSPGVKTTTGVGASAIDITSHNYALNHGGLRRPKLLSEKEELITRAFGKSKSTRNMVNELGKSVRGIPS